MNAQTGQLPNLVISRRGDALLVDARLLHARLEIDTRFNDWIVRRLADALAVEGEDYYSALSKTGATGRPPTEYALTLDLAKELAMLERTERGREIRRYFIQAEKDLRGQPANAALDISDPLVLAQKFIEAETERRALTAQVETLTPKAQVYDALVSSEGSYSVAEAAKILGTGEIRLFRLLRERGTLMSAATSGIEHHNVPYQRYIEAGYFEVVTRPRPGGEGRPDRVSYTTRVLAKGLAWIQRGMAQNLQLERPA